MKGKHPALAVVPLLAVTLLVRTAASSSEPSAEEYAIYAAILAARWGGEGKSPFVIQRETSDAAHSPNLNRTADFLKKEFKEKDPSVLLDEELIESFWRVRDSSVQLNPKRLKVPNATIVSSKDIDQVFRNSRPLANGWAAFRKRFDAAWGIVRFSRVGFSADGTRALLSVSGSCGPLCGSGDYVFLRKGDGEWQLVASVIAWIS